MADQSLSRGFPVGRNMIFLHITQYDLQDLLILFGSKTAVRVGYDVMSPSGIKSRYGIAAFIHTYGILRLVSVMKRLVHSHNGLHTPVNQLRREAADPNQIVSDFGYFKLKLPLIAHGLKLASAALPVKGALRLHTKRRRCKHLL